MLRPKRPQGRLPVVAGTDEVNFLTYSKRSKKMETKKKTKKVPSLKTMERWMANGAARATDGCKVEPDGTCPHGKQSWLLVLGLI